MSSQFSEDALVEQPAIALFAGLWWEISICFDEKFCENSTLGRETSSEVVLLPRLLPMPTAKLETVGRET